MDALLLFGEGGYDQQIAALGGSNLGLIERFVIRGPASCGQFGACLGDDGRFLGTLDSGTITPVQQPRDDASGTDGDGRNCPQQDKRK
ncbi:hypothetical protein [Stenotrophomonas maltophilia]|uniref:hypothetical protein n=1 Tax=Stenotrophomonas maltophilia TaxID=40324 RepID=UPI00066E725D|nr:hypothetical protein [Stenotrophomonas maltophilia]